MNGFSFIARIMPIFDSMFFERMVDDIAHNRFSPEGMFLVVSFFGLFGLALGIGLSIKTVHKSTVDVASFTWIIQRQEILSLFEKVMSQRSKIRLSFHREDKRSRSTDASLLEITENSLVLELSTVKRLNPAWIGNLIDCDFRVKENEKADTFSFFHFVAEIRDIRQNAEGILELEASLPLRLEASQKRAHLRIDPPARLIPIFQCWRSQDLEQGKTNQFNIATWPSPRMEIIPGHAHNPGEIVDLSGGGMGLDIESHAMDDGPHKLAALDDVYILMHLGEPDTEAVLKFYLSARVLIVREDVKNPGRHILGLRFIRKGSFIPGTQSGLNWSAVEDSGVREIDDWVFNRHLDSYRLRGGA